VTVSTIIPTRKPAAIEPHIIEGRSRQRCKLHSGQ
jgi:hypothetical protein